MTKYRPYLKAIIILVAVIFLFAKFNPFACIKNDPVDILNQANLSKNVNIDTANPSSIGYIETVKVTHPSIKDVIFNPKTGVLDIRYKQTSHFSGQIEVRDFAYQSANVLQTLKYNDKIKAIAFSQDVDMINSKNIHTAFYACFSRKNFTSIDFTSFKYDFRKKNMFPIFFNRANSYKIAPALIEDMSPEAQKELKK